jgi:hypothetical protein
LNCISRYQIKHICAKVVEDEKSMVAIMLQSPPPSPPHVELQILAGKDASGPPFSCGGAGRNKATLHSIILLLDIFILFTFLVVTEHRSYLLPLIKQKLFTFKRKVA